MLFVRILESKYTIFSKNELRILLTKMRYVKNSYVYSRRYNGLFKKLKSSFKFFVYNMQGFPPNEMPFFKKNWQTTDFIISRVVNRSIISIKCTFIQNNNLVENPLFCFLMRANEIKFILWIISLWIFKVFVWVLLENIKEPRNYTCAMHCV